jgi:cell division protein FtsL
MNSLIKTKTSYAFIYFLIILFAIGGLIISIKSIKLNAAIQEQTKKLTRLKEENESLELSLLDKTKLESVESEAKSRGMIKPPSTQGLYYEP